MIIHPRSEQTNFNPELRLEQMEKASGRTVSAGSAIEVIPTRFDRFNEQITIMENSRLKAALYGVGTVAVCATSFAIETIDTFHDAVYETVDHPGAVGVALGTISAFSAIRSFKNYDDSRSARKEALSIAQKQQTQAEFRNKTVPTWAKTATNVLQPKPLTRFLPKFKK